MKCTAHLLRDVFILLKLVGHDDEVGAAFLALRNEHAGLDAEFTGLIVGGGDLPRPLSAVGVGHSQGLAPEGGVSQACHRCKEAVHVQVNDGTLCCLPNCLPCTAPSPAEAISHSVFVPCKVPDPAEARS